MGIQRVTGGPVKTRPTGGYMGGLWVQLKISSAWTLQSEVIRSEKGTGGGPKYYNNYWLQLSYLEVPILCQYTKKNVYVEFGPTIAACVGSGDYSKVGPSPIQTDLYPISKKDIAFSLGVGCILNEKWVVGLRLNHSLIPIRKQFPGTSMGGYNQGLILSVGRQISFKNLRTKHRETVE